MVVAGRCGEGDAAAEERRCWAATVHVTADDCWEWAAPPPVCASTARTNFSHANCCDALLFGRAFTATAPAATRPLRRRNAIEDADWAFGEAYGPLLYLLLLLTVSLGPLSLRIGDAEPPPPLLLWRTALPLRPADEGAPQSVAPPSVADEGDTIAIGIEGIDIGGAAKDEEA